VEGTEGEAGEKREKGNGKRGGRHSYRIKSRPEHGRRRRGEGGEA
jgi:hypothetical protein